MGKPKKKKKTVDRLAKTEETFYQLTVADCEKKISRLRKHLNGLDEHNTQIIEKIRSLNEDHVDVAADMTRNVREFDNSISILNEKILVLSKEYGDVKSKGDATISDLEAKYAAMHNQLTAEIKMLKAHLKALEEYHSQEEKLNQIIEIEEERRKAKEQEHKDVLHAMEHKNQQDRHVLRKQVERELLFVTEEFTRSSAMRNAAYAQRLIRENIALQKEIDMLASSQRIKDQQLKEKISFHKEIKTTFPALDQEKRELILIAEQKTQVIEQLTTRYEKLKEEYVEYLRYKNQYRDLMDEQLCRHHKRQQLTEQFKKLSTNMHALKAEQNQLELQSEQNEMEIERLHGLLADVKDTILSAINIGDRRLPQTTTQRSEEAAKYPSSEQAEAAEKREEEQSPSQTTTQRSEETAKYSCSEMILEQVEEAQKREEEQSRMNLLKTLFGILQNFNTQDSSSSGMETASPTSSHLHDDNLVQRSADSLLEMFKYNVEDIDNLEASKLGPNEESQAQQLDGNIIPTERARWGTVFDVESGSSLYVSSMGKREPSIVEEQQDRLEDSSSYFSGSEPRQAETPPPIPQALTKSEALAPGTIVDVEMDENDDEIEFDDANADLQHASYDNSDELDVPDEEQGMDEEEMSIYMFY